MSIWVTVVFSEPRRAPGTVQALSQYQMLKVCVRRTLSICGCGERWAHIAESGLHLAPAEPSPGERSGAKAESPAVRTEPCWGSRSAVHPEGPCHWGRKGRLKGQR